MPEELTIDALLSPRQETAEPSACERRWTPAGAQAMRGVWPAQSIDEREQAVVPTGWSALDAELPGGGWPTGAVVEILSAQTACLEWQVLGGALRALTASGQPVVAIGPPRRPHPPGLAQAGIDPQQLVWALASAPSERLWVAEQYVRANAATVVAWLPQALPAQIRRLQVGAQRTAGLVVMFRPMAARREPSAAAVRMAVELQGDWKISVEIFKRRGPPMATPLTLPSVPGSLTAVLSRRTRRPSHSRPWTPAAAPGQRQRSAVVPAEAGAGSTGGVSTVSSAVSDAASALGRPASLAARSPRLAPH